MTEGPLLWYLNRGTGIVLVVLLTVVVVLGVLARRVRSGGRVPGFVLPALHRNLSALTVALMLVHGGTAVADEYVDIRWWQLVVPWRLSYEPRWLALGVVACDLVLVVVLTSAMRARLGHRGWRVVHATTYLAWLAGMTHATGIGTDTSSQGACVVYVSCAALMVVALAVRVTGPWSRRWAPRGAAR
jgi:sulfoxide reductase heme-binding subunit YedZ